MSDLISRAELLAEIKLAIEDSGCVNHERDILDCIRYAQTVDAAPVVRCKDCALGDTDGPRIAGIVFCDHFDQGVGLEFYCAAGRATMGEGEHHG